MADINRKWPWPANVGLLGTHPEEVKALRARIEKNPDASPMPEVAPGQLLTPTKNSERLRMGEPVSPYDAAQETWTVTLTHVVLRRVLARMRRRAAVVFDERVEGTPLGDVPANRRDQMRKMIDRERAMLEIFDRYNGLAEHVYMRLLASSKG